MPETPPVRAYFAGLFAVPRFPASGLHELDAKAQAMPALIRAEGASTHRMRHAFVRRPCACMASSVRDSLPVQLRLDASQVQSTALEEMMTIPVLAKTTLPGQQ